MLGNMKEGQKIVVGERGVGKHVTVMTNIYRGHRSKGWMLNVIRV